MILHRHFTNNFVTQSVKLYVYFVYKQKTNFHSYKFPCVLNVTPLPYTISQLTVRLRLWHRMYLKMLWKHGFQTSFKCLSHWLHFDQSFQIVDNINTCLNGRQTFRDYHSEPHSLVVVPIVSQECIDVTTFYEIALWLEE